ncbi:zinc metalloprotease [Actinomadura chokoriensis]|uniref:Zinc metalloprotease n=1 Tax=Actinomadura chokoriensis TaxID=454156 RepID=A0ABV4R044_9ACTN
MKLLAAAVLLAALVPTVPSGPTAAPQRGRAGDCTHPEARLRTGGRGMERNDLTPAQAATVEQRLNRVLDGLRLGGQGADAQSDGAGIRTAAQITVPVYFHVIHDGAKGNVSTEEVNRQISTMNASYGGGNGGADTQVSFELREISRSDNAAWFQDPERYEGTYKPQLHKGGKGTLNLYSTYIGGDLLGWSTFPWKYQADPQMDGVTIHYGSMPDGYIEHFNRGFSATHEVGHWLGLYHTFQDGCGGNGDRVADTPPERDPTNGCPTDKDTCPSPGTDPVHNYMDYSYDTCMTSFTAGQGTRMHEVWAAYRA